MRVRASILMLAVSSAGCATAPRDVQAPCESPAPLDGTLYRSSPGYIIRFGFGSSVIDVPMTTGSRSAQRAAQKLAAATTAQALADRYGLSITANFPNGMGIGATEPNVIAALRCAPEVKGISHNAPIWIDGT